MSKFNIGDMVIMTREPTAQEWQSFGELNVPSEYYTTPHKITKIGDHGSIELDNDLFVYPECCFELSHEYAAEKYKKDVQKQFLLEDAAQKFPPGTRFKNAYGSTSTIADTSEYQYNDDYIYAQCLSGRYVRIYDKLSGWAEIISRPSPSNRTEAKQGDYIRIIDGRGNSSLEGNTYFIVNVKHNRHFDLAKAGAGGEATENWTCSDPSCYELRNTVEVVNEYKEKEYSAMDMSNYEPTPRELRVGDRVKVTGGRSPYFNIGEISVIEKIEGTSIKMHSNKTGYALWIGENDIEHTDSYPRYSVDLPVFDHSSITNALSKLPSDYFNTNKNQQNGTESNKQSVKLQGVNLKIRQSNPIRGIGLKSPRVKIRIGSYNRYN